MLNGLISIIGLSLQLPKLWQIGHFVISAVKTAQAVLDDSGAEKKTKAMTELYDNADLFLDLDEKTDAFVKQSLPHAVEIALIAHKVFGWDHD